jgi:hypothetical protein
MAMYSPSNFTGYGTAPRHVRDGRQHNFSPETLAQWERFVKDATKYKVWSTVDQPKAKEIFCSQIHMGVNYHEAVILIKDMVVDGFLYKNS